MIFWLWTQRNWKGIGNRYALRACGHRPTLHAMMTRGSSAVASTNSRASLEKTPTFEDESLHFPTRVMIRVHKIPTRIAVFSNTNLCVEEHKSWCFPTHRLVRRPGATYRHHGEPIECPLQTPSNTIVLRDVRRVSESVLNRPPWCRDTPISRTAKVWTLLFYQTGSRGQVGKRHDVLFICIIL